MKGVDVASEPEDDEALLQRQLSQLEQLIDSGHDLLSRLDSQSAALSAQTAAPTPSAGEANADAGADAHAAVEDDAVADSPPQTGPSADASPAPDLPAD